MTQSREDRLTQIARSWGITHAMGHVYSVLESDLFRLLESYSFADAGAFQPPVESFDNLRSKNHELVSMVAELTEKLQVASEAEARAQKELAALRSSDRVSDHVVATEQGAGIARHPERSKSDPLTHLEVDLLCADAE